MQRLKSQLPQPAAIMTAALEGGGGFSGFWTHYRGKPWSLAAKTQLCFDKRSNRCYACQKL